MAPDARLACRPNPPEGGAMPQPPCVCRRIVLAALILLAAAGGLPAAAPSAMNSVAERYVQLVLAVGQHDADYVDAYYGPPALKAAAETEKAPLATLRARVAPLRRELATVDLAGADELIRLRHGYLDRQLASVESRIALLEGAKLSFDEESRQLYDAVAPSYPESHFQRLLAELEPALPGAGTLAERLEAFRRGFVIPPGRIDAVFQAAIAAARARTLQHLTLPAGESFVVEYVTDKPWSAYNWYKGGFHSVIQVNTSLPIFIDRAIDLACHEGYPGHHVYNVLLEKHLVRDRGWVEFSVYPLFSPQSLIAEGTGNYGITVAYPDQERLAFVRDVLFPLAGLDPARAADYDRVLRLTRQLSYAGNEAARRYVNGEIDAASAADWLTRYELMEPARARQRVKFIARYRSYVINYNFGEDLVAAYVERLAGGAPKERWRIFGELISSPRLPSGIR
jgi:hypothetical protein